MPRQWIGTWRGGRVALKRDRSVYVIEATRAGKCYTIALDVASEDGALAELALFERNPVGYTPPKAAGPVGAGPVVTAVTIDRFLAARLSDSEAPITTEHAADLRRYLTRWMTRLGGKDLRTITLAEYHAHVEALGLPRHHIKALRAFTKWLRKTGQLTSTEDTSRDLSIPQPRARRAAPGFRPPSVEEVEKVYAALATREVRQRGTLRHSLEYQAEAIAFYEAHSAEETRAKYSISESVLHKWKYRVWRNREAPEKQMTPAQEVRDVVALRALTGMHHTEVERVAKGDWPVVEVTGHGEIAGVVRFFHKKGLVHPQALPKKALEAAQRLQARGRAPDDATVGRMIAEAAKKAGVRAFSPTLLRHFFVTTAKHAGRVVKPSGGGVSRDDIAAIVGHTSAKTTELYDSEGVPMMISLPVRLENAEDPT